MKTFRFNHYGKSGPDELFYITTPAESDVYVLKTEAEAEIAALHERQRVLVEAVNVGLKRNHIITDAEDFKQHLQGTWVAIPEQNFDHIRAALAAKEG